MAKGGNKVEKTAGTTEHKPIFEGNKGTRTHPGRSSMLEVLCKYLIIES